MKKRNKCLIILIVLALMSGMIPAPLWMDGAPVSVKAASEENLGELSGTDGNIAWELTKSDKAWDLETGEPYKLTLRGSGEMNNYSERGEGLPPWAAYKPYIVEICVEEGVTSIGSYAFCKCASLQYISLAQSVVSIGKKAFQECSLLNNPPLNEGLLDIGEMAFAGCASLQTITFPETLKSIGSQAFYLTKLQSITLPANVESVAPRAFFRLTSLRKINVAAGNTHFTVQDNVLYENGEDGNPYAAIAFAAGSFIFDLMIVPGTEIIKESAFQGAGQLTTVILPDSVKTIGNAAFSECNNLYSVSMGSGLETIGVQAFYRCSLLKEFIFPETLKFIGDLSFSGNKALQEIHIPDSVETIGSCAFENNTSLKKASFGKGVREIRNPFLNCTSLTELTISEENPYLQAVESVIYNKEGTILYCYAPGKQQKTYRLLETTQRVVNEGIYGSSYLEKLYLPASLAHVELQGIYGNRNLISIYFEGNAPMLESYNACIGGNSYQTVCYKMKESTGWDGVNEEGEANQWSQAAKYAAPGGFQYWDPANGTKLEGDIGGLHWTYWERDRSLMLEGEGAVPNYTEGQARPWESVLTEILTVETSGVSEIGDYAFANAPKLMRIKSDASLKRVGASAFKNGENLKFANIASVKEVGASAFENDGALREENLMLNQADVIGVSAFQGCSALGYVSLSDNLASLEENVFSGCRSLVQVDIPKSVTEIKAGALSGCTGISVLRIPAGTTLIGAGAFRGDSSLEKVFFYGGIPAEWAEDSFSDCNKASFYYRMTQPGWKTLGDTHLGRPLIEINRFYTERQDCYSFENSAQSFGYAQGYRIPRQRFVDVFHDIVRATYYYAINEKWNGSCYGMAMSSLLFYEDPQQYTLSNYDAKAQNLYQAAAPQAKDASLTKLIERANISQYRTMSTKYGGLVSQYRIHYRDLVEQIQRFEYSGGSRVDETAESMVILLYGGYSGHAVVPVSVSQGDNGDYLVQVYDPDRPEALQTVTISGDYRTLSYGGYDRAHFITSSEFARIMSPAAPHEEQPDTSVYISVDKEDAVVTDKEGRGIEEIEDACEQIPLSGGADGGFRGIRSFILPKGAYQVTAKEGKSADTSTSVAFYLQTGGYFAKVNAPGSDAELFVDQKDSAAGGEQGDVELSISSAADKAEAVSFTVMNQQGFERTIEITGSSPKVTLKEDQTIAAAVAEGGTVAIDGKEAEIINGQASVSFAAGAEETPYKVNDLAADIRCGEDNKLSGTVSASIMSNAPEQRNAAVTADFLDENGKKAASYTKEYALDPGFNAIELSLKELETAFVQKEGEVSLSCVLTVKEGEGYAAVSSIDGIKIMLTKQPGEGEEDPDHPGKPGEGEDPDHPEKPGEGEDPDHPEKPGEEDPDHPEKPGEEDPDHPENPGKPGEGEDPEKPGEGEDPEKPGTGEGGSGNSGNTGNSGVQNPPASSEKDPKKEETVRIESIRITAKTKTVVAGNKLKLNAEILPKAAAGQRILWESSNGKYAAVDQNGVVTTKKAGTGKKVTIMAKARDGSGKSGSISIKIKKATVKKIKLKVKSKKLKAGKKLKITAKVTVTGSAASKKLKWISSNKKYATVSSKGVVKAKKAGRGKTVTITAKATDGSKKKAKIKIKIK